MQDKNYNIRHPVDTAANYRMTVWLFALLGAGFIGVAIYFHVRITEWEQQGGFMDWWRGYDQLYDAFGKWGVVLFNLIVALIFFTASGFSFRMWRRLASEEKRRGEKPQG